MDGVPMYGRRVIIPSSLGDRPGRAEQSPLHPPVSVKRSRQDLDQDFR